MNRIILASASPRRHAILAALELVFDVVDAGIDEVAQDGEAPIQLARRLATAKAQAVAHLFPGDIVLGADTVVALGAMGLGKPHTPDAAVQMLRRLRGRVHQVITGVAAVRFNPQGGAEKLESWTRHATTRVWMRSYSDEEIERYVESGDPFDKAGAYAIQHQGFHPVARLDGCYLNVVGLPPREVQEVLRLAGADIVPVPPARLERICPGCHEASALAD